MQNCILILPNSLGLLLADNSGEGPQILVATMLGFCYFKLCSEILVVIQIVFWDLSCYFSIVIPKLTQWRLTITCRTLIAAGTQNKVHTFPKSPMVSFHTAILQKKVKGLCMILKHITFHLSVIFDNKLKYYTRNIIPLYQCIKHHIQSYRIEFFIYNGCFRLLNDINTGYKSPWTYAKELAKLIMQCDYISLSLLYKIHLPMFPPGVYLHWGE